MMEYKSYAAGPIDFDLEDKTFSGSVAGLRDVIHFDGRTATELARAFRESICGHLKLCDESWEGPHPRPRSACSTTRSISASGAGFPVHISNCRAPCCTNISTPLTPGIPRALASFRSGVSSGL